MLMATCVLTGTMRLAPSRANPPSRAFRLVLHLLLVRATLLHAATNSPRAFGHLLDEIFRTALRAGFEDRRVPGRELALGVAIAAVEGLAAARAALLYVSLPALGAGDAERARRRGERLDVPAFGISRAAEELPEAAVAHDHFLAALRAGLGMRDDFFDLDRTRIVDREVLGV